MVRWKLAERLELVRFVDDPKDLDPVKVADSEIWRRYYESFYSKLRGARSRERVIAKLAQPTVPSPLRTRLLEMLANTEVRTRRYYGPTRTEVKVKRSKNTMAQPPQ